MSLLTITSHHHLHRSHNTVTLHKSEIISRQLPATVQQHLPYFNHGTRVTIRDLFGSMPVRVRQRAITAEKQGGYSKEWEGLRRGIVMLLLAWPFRVSVTLQETGTGQKLTLRSLPNISSAHTNVLNACNILSQASYIAPTEMSSWVPVSASTSKLKIDGTISLEPSATKGVQFVSFGIRPLVTDGQSIVHDEINRLFSNSSFGNEDEAPDLDIPDKVKRTKETRAKGNVYNGKEPRGKRKALERWPMFYFDIQQTSMPKMLAVDDILEGYSNALFEINELLKAMIIGFLTKYHFQPKIVDQPNPKEPQSSAGAIDHAVSQTSTDEAATSRTSTTCSPSKMEKIPAKDILGTDIKLPSFRQTDPRLDSPFEAWSRVKRGGVLSKHGTDIYPDRPTYIQVPNLDRPSSAPPRTSTPVLAPTMKTTPLLSYTGEVLRRPFDDISIGGARTELCSQDQAYSDERELRPDELVPWMNPMTKVTSLVNKRTGLVAPAILNDSKGNVRLSSRIKSESQALLTAEPSPWLASVLDKWDNPVFHPTETAIQQISLSGQDLGTSMEKFLQGHSCHDSHFDIENAFKELPVGTTGRISKDALRNAEVISQVDKKFILVKLYLSKDKENKEDGRGAMLVVVDQHAADERIRIEQLMDELCMPPQPNGPSGSGVRTTLLEKPLSFIVSPKEICLLNSYRLHFADWGILYNLPSSSANMEDEQHAGVTIRGLPPGIAERCKANPKLIIELIRTEIWKLHDQGANPRVRATSTAGENPSWATKVHNCPIGVIDMLNSRACRSAIMFNDELSNEQCKVLISRLGECAFPFQCAHGRPSLVPLVDLGTLRTFTGTDDGE